MNLGEINELEVLRYTSVGAYLGDEEGNDVLLPNQYLLEDYEIGEKVSVFIYKDSEDRLIASTETPYIFLNQFRSLKVKDTGPFGAFLDWGLRLGKDLFVPFKEQRQKMEVGKYYVVTLRIDEATERLIASTKVNKYTSPCEDETYLNKEVSVLIAEKSELGLIVIVDDLYRGIIYKNDINQSLRIGQIVPAFVYNIREDGKLDVRLVKAEVERFDDAANDLLKLLEEHKVVYLSDKSEPDEIREQLKMSKKMFKQAVGKLYKARKISIFDNRIELL